jgi:beta-glucanase (GH16 family)
MCANASTRSIHLGYWYDSKEHETILALGFDAAASYHTYGVHWEPTRIDWLVDRRVG